MAILSEQNTLERTRDTAPPMRAATANSRAEILIAAADCFREQGYSPEKFFKKPDSERCQDFLQKILQH